MALILLKSASRGAAGVMAMGPRMGDGSMRCFTLIGAMGLLGCLLLPTRGWGGASEEPGVGLSAVQVKDGQDFTRVVFLSDRPDATSLELDRENARFLI